METLTTIAVLASALGSVTTAAVLLATLIYTIKKDRKNNK